MASKSTDNTWVGLVSTCFTMTLLLFTQVLEVNGHSCVDIDHYEAVGILKAAGSYITLRVVREIDPDATSSSLPPTLHTQQQVDLSNRSKD